MVNRVAEGTDDAVAAAAPGVVNEGHWVEVELDEGYWASSRSAEWEGKMDGGLGWTVNGMWEVDGGLGIRCGSGTDW